MDRSTPHETALSYEGRRLPRPEEEVVDQGLGFDIGTLMNRRKVLTVFGLGASAFGLAACGAGAGGSGASASSSASTSPSPSATALAVDEIPDETAGPYPGDGSNGPNVLEQSGIVRSDLRSSVKGTPSAVPPASPKLERRSLRTSPLCSSTSGPLEPSPG